MEKLCLVPPELEAKLLDPLRRHFEGTDVRVMVERRRGERRSGAERRKRDQGPPDGTADQRRIKNQPDNGGRRVGERRAGLVAAEPPPDLPRKARPYIKELSFCERVPLSEERAEDQDTARLVTRIQANGRAEFAALYERYFDRVYGYLRVLLRDHHEAEDLAQHAFIKAMEGLPGYERRRQPFRAWLFVIVRNTALNYMRKQGHVEPEDPTEVARLHDNDLGAVPPALRTLDWITDNDLMVFVERLPPLQRQVLVLRFMFDLSPAETAEILDKSPNDVSALQYRALKFLRERLASVGRAPERRGKTRMRIPVNPAHVLRRRRFALLNR